MIELRTLGSVDVQATEGEGALQGSVQPKRLALLVYLALEDLSGFRRRDMVVGLLWPELDALHARGALRQALHSLRRLIGEGAILVRGDDEIGINRDEVWCDAAAFRAHAAAGRHDEALDLYRGDFLDGFFASDVAPEFDQWVADTRLELRRRASDSAWTLAAAVRATGDLPRAAALARRASALSLDDESGVARLIAFLDELGDRGGALEVYSELATRLRSEYDADPSPETQALIERVRYRTVPKSIKAPDVIGEPAREVPGLPLPAPVSSTRNPLRRLRNVVALLAGCLIIAAVAMRRGFGERPYSVAVMPLQDLGGDTSRAYIADGLTDQLITDLAQLGTLDVISRRTMMSYRGSRKTLREIARELDVDAVLSGTIQHLGDTVRMTAQIVLARDNRMIWAQTFEGSRGDLLRMQREAARIGAQSIRGVLTPAQSASLPRVRAFQPEALDLYIRGRYYWNKRGDGLLRSIALFTEALDIDPTFALAYSGMADAYVQLGYGNGLAPGDAFPKARAAATRALQLDSTLAEPHAALAFVHLYYDWDWPGADREFREAIARNPSYATGHEWYGLFLAAMGRFDEARRHETRAEALDPLSVGVAGTAAWVAYYAGDYQTAKRQLHVALREDGNFALGHLYLGRAFEANGEMDSAMVQYELAGPLRDWAPTVAAKGYLLGIIGNDAEARRSLIRLDSLARTRYVTAYGVALVHAGLRQPDSALAWLERGAAERTNWMVWLNRDPRWASMRSDHRFRALTKRIGLPD